MRFSQSDIQRFAEWSHDRNPLHVDPVFARDTHFGRNIAHGMLSVLAAVASADETVSGAVSALDIEFRGAVVPGQDYDVVVSAGQAGYSAIVRNADGSVLNVSATSAAGGESGGDWTWAAALVESGRRPETGIRREPVSRSVSDLERGIEVIGAWAADASAADRGYSAIGGDVARVLALCSYIVGMEIPGERSLFTRASLQFATPTSSDRDPGGELWFRARTQKFDRTFRMLETRVDITTAAGVPVATGVLRSYAPFGRLTTSLDDVASWLAPEARSLDGRVALVCGGSRGLGADISAALALAGARVYVNARGGAAAIEEFSTRLAVHGKQVQFLQGDAGDAEWCRVAIDRILAAHGRLDVLVLNACGAPTPLRIGPDAARRHDAYVQENLRLVHAPLAASLDALAESAGGIVYVSSSFVDEAPAGFAHYVALKQAGEAIVRTAQKERPSVRAIVARPPRLQTTWNDTPAGVAGAIPTGWAAVHIVNRLVAGGETRGAAIVSEYPPLAAVAAPAPQPTGPEFPVRVAASFTTDPLVPALQFWFRELGANAQFDIAPYGQVLQTLLDPSSPLLARGGINIVLLRVRDWLHELSAEKAGSIEFVRGYLQEMARDIERAFKAHRARAAAETLLLFCPSYGASSAAESILLRQAETDLAAALAGVPGLQIAYAADFHGHYAVDEDEISDPIRDKLAHIPYRDAYYHTLATIIARQAHRRLAPLRKVVVVDCDNTLWRGVVGEVGPEGLEFDASHRALHERLTRLTESGLLVCLCSKNEEADVWRVFETRPDFGLRRETVIAATINWQVKSENLRTLAARLNLGLDSFIFIDDNPVECAEVRARCPEVLTLQWPLEPERALRLLQHTWELDAVTATAEDQRRTQMYREEFARQELRDDTLTFADFISNLALEVDFAPLTETDLRRSAQLTLRTNQFNFTTRRREESELQTLMASAAHDIRTVRVKDRFGDYGLVGLVIAEFGAEALLTDTFLLSCRVLGRGVEHRIAAELGRMAVARGLKTVRMRVDTTKRNTPARKFLEFIAPEPLRQIDDAGLQCDFPAELLADVRFEPTEQPGYVPAEAEGGSKKESASPSATPETAAGSLRVREERIVRTAFELTDPAVLAAAIEGRVVTAGASSKPRTVNQPAAQRESADAIAPVVYQAFADALRTTTDSVKDLDRLEALGCDSMKIVEITVALLEKYPWLPSTLLFEHRSVSSIVREIATMAAGTPGTEPSAIVASTVANAPVRPATGEIAVVGMHVRTAGANSPAELWELLRNGRSAVLPVPVERKHFLHPLTDSRPHWAGLLDEVGRFDAELFGISPREAEFMDPQLRLFLEVAWSAIEDAGASGRDHDPSTGVFAGVMYGDYGYRANGGGNGDNPYRCWEGFSLANRLSQLLGFHGPSLAVDTACSSSGTALHLACQALNAGDCRVAVVGGVNLILDPDRFGSLGRLGILSPRGKCEPFGADADGTVLGEGVGVVVLRPLQEAIDRGDRIYGVIKGTGLSTGSGTVGFTAPNPQAQAEAIQRSLRAARIDPRTISYVECHGTGTVLGDPIEVRGLTLAYSNAELQDRALAVEQRCAIGSIKPNIGHLEAGAGIVGLIKVLLQMQHGTLLPSVTSSQPNPHIPFAGSVFDVQRELRPWERLVARSGEAEIVVPRRAGLSSFGVGGANAHVIVEEPPVDGPRRSGAERPAHVLTVSAPSEEALRSRIAVMTQAMTNGEESIADFCYSANVGQRLFESRVALVGRTREQLAGMLEAVAAGGEVPGAVRNTSGSTTAPKVAFLFTGQGSQYAGMGEQLYRTHPVFRDALDRCARIFDRLLGQPLLELLFAPEGSEKAALLNQTGFTQPALFAFEYALSELWKSFGVTPDLVMGHSVGELAALCVAGGVSLDDGLKLIAARGRLMQALPPGGTMTSVMAAEDLVLKAIAGAEESVAIAAINAPTQVVISGAGVAVAEISARLEADGIKTKALTVSHAFHSPLMRPMLAEYEAVVREIRFSVPAIPFVSCVDGALLGEELTQPEYWLRQVMDPVRFTDGMRVLEQQQVDAFVEIGPHPVLLGMARQCVADRDEGYDWLPSLRKDGDAWSTLLGSVATLYVEGGAIDWRAFDAPYARRRVSIPPYPFGGRQYWLRDLPPVPSPGGRRAIAEPAPGVAAGVTAYEPRWEPSPMAPAATGEAAASRRFVIFADERGIGAQLAGVLHDRGARTVVVVRGERFATTWDGHYEVNPARVEDFTRLWATLADESAEPVTAVHLWNVDAESDASAQDGIDSAARATLGAGIRLVQTAARAKLRPTLWFVTQGAASIPGDAAGAVAVTQAPLWGLGRTVALEHAEVWGGLVDLARGDVRGELTALADTLLRPDDEDQIALRQGQRHVLRLAPAPRRRTAPLSLAGEATYLVTGGVGALGMHVARWLVARGARHLVLTSRRAARNAAIEPALSELERSGATVRLVAADVSRREDVDRMLAEIAASGHPLRGVVHAAGVDLPVPLSELKPADLRSVLSAKVTGGWLLHERTRDLSLDLFVCFSSMASLLGAQGRAHYGAANAFLDALVDERRRLGLPATGINWGPWKGGGMADANQLEQFERIGNFGLEPEAALAALDDAVTAAAAHTMVADIDWPLFRSIYEARRARPAVSALTSPRVAATSSAVVDAATAAADRSAPRPADSRPEWVESLATTPADERLARLESLLKQEVAHTLGFEAVDALPVDRSFYQLGMDSLMTAELVGRLRKRVGMSCTALVFDYPTIRGLAPRLLEALTDTLANVPAAIATPAAPAVTVPGTAAAQPPAVATRAELTALLRRELNQTLGFAADRAVRVDQPFAEMGLDSLLSAEFAGRVQKRLGVRVGAAVFDHPTLDRLAERLFADVRPMPATAPADSTSQAPLARAVTAGLEGYSEGVEHDVLAFQTAAWPRRPVDTLLARWRWMFVDGARRLGLDPRVWLYRDQGRIVGHMGAIPVRLKIGGEERSTAWLVDTMVLERYRSTAVGSRLMVGAHEDLPFALSLGQTAEMRDILVRLGWKEVAPLQTAQLLIRPEHVLEGKLPGPAAWVAGMGMRASSAMRDLLRDRPQFTVREVARFDASHDRLWTTMAADVRCGVVRDASFLNWKYVDQPGQSFVRLEVRDGAELKGIAVLMFREPDAAYRYRRAFLVDVVAPLSDDDVMQQVLRAAASVAAEKGADALICLHINGYLTRALERCGFRLRKPTRFLVVSPDSLPANLQQEVTTADAWFVTQGDSDIDRPGQ